MSCDGTKTINSTSVLSEEDAVTDKELENINDLKDQLERDLIACDMKWILFVAAAQSYRYDSLLKPYPPAFSNPDDERTCNIDRLHKVIDAVPPLKLVRDRLIKVEASEMKAIINDDIFQLLYWALVKSTDPNLKTVQTIDVRKF